MPQPLRIAIVGPTHPYSGGISSHTTTLANELRAAGHDVELISWKAQYPKFLRSGQIRVPDGEPEVTPFPRATFPLTWYNPLSWLRAGRRMRRADLVVVTAITPYHAVPYLVMRWGFGRKPVSAVVAHNVLPHEGGALDKVLVRALYRAYGRVLTHSDKQQALARRIAGEGVELATARLPLPDFVFGEGLTALGLQGRDAAPEGERPARPLTLLFFGTVREYKGVDLLIEALARVPELRLIVAGEFWQPIDDYRALVERLGLTKRVELVDGYVKMAHLPELFARADVLALPYRTGSATVNVTLGFLFGLPVLATDAGTLADDIRDGVDGLVVPAGEVEALAAGLERLAVPGTVAALRGSVDTFQLDAPWQAYVTTLEELAGFDRSSPTGS